MAGEHIFIVEDERIVAEDLKRMLERLGFAVVGSVSTGEDALKQIETTKPDLVLMDIRIRGSLDGVDVAEHVVAEFDIPVIYLTAYADETTVDRAKGTLPSGYILKPFEERSLKTTVDLALYRHKMDQMLKMGDEWHGGILENLGVAVMATDVKGTITYMNKMAERLTGQFFGKAFGRPLKDVLPAGLHCDESPVHDSEGRVKGTALVLKKKD
jgi:CheY-like chemotaxis protein